MSEHEGEELQKSYLKILGASFRRVGNAGHLFFYHREKAEESNDDGEDDGEEEGEGDGEDSFWGQEEQFFTPGMEDSGPPLSLDQRSASIGVYPFPFFLSAQRRDEDDPSSLGSFDPVMEESVEVTRYREERDSDNENEAEGDEDIEGGESRESDSEQEHDAWVPAEELLPPGAVERGSFVPRTLLRFVCLTLAPLPLVGDSFSPPHFDEYTRQAAGYGSKKTRRSASMPHTHLPHPLRTAVDKLVVQVQGLLSAYALQLIRKALQGRPSSVVEAGTARTLLRHLSALPLTQRSVAEIPLSFLEPLRAMPMFLNDLTCSPHLSLLPLSVEPAYGEEDGEPSLATASRTFLVAQPFARLVETNPIDAPWEEPVQPAEAQAIELRYWLLLTVSSGANLVAVQLHAPGLSEPDVASLLERTVMTVQAICRSVNQRLLLWSLHKTSHCSPLLDSDEGKTIVPGTGVEPHTQPATVPPYDPSKDPFLLHMRSREVPVNEVMFLPENYRPGRFACPIVHTIHLPLHYRMDPDKAASALIGMQC